jgi:ubiquinone/menaquinone biosynthesis C-methylase UbiE
MNYYTKYYGAGGDFLKEHRKYFTPARLRKEAGFIISVLKLKKKDRILDLACGNGRHTIELNRRGFQADGLDCSDYLLGIAKKEAKKKGLKINFYRQDVKRMKLKKQYDKALLFFSDFGLLDPKKTLKNIWRVLKKDGLFLLDYPSAFAALSYLAKHPKDPLVFDFDRMELQDKKGNVWEKYYTFSEVKNLLAKTGFKVVKTFGDHGKQKLGFRSRRVIIVARRK